MSEMEEQFVGAYDWTSERAMFPKIAPELRAILFHGLSEIHERPQASEDWRALLPAIVNFRLAGLALAAHSDGAVALPGRLVEQLRGIHRMESVRSAAAETHARDAVEALDNAGIASVVIKGPAIAAMYRAPHLRPFADVDLLVAPREFSSARRILARLGFEDHARPEPRAYFRRYCLEATNLRGVCGRSIDLHHHISPWVWGRRLDFEQVRKGAVLSADGTLYANPIHQLLIVGLHLLSDKTMPGNDLMVWRDLATIARQVDPTDAAEEAERVGLTWILSFLLEHLDSEVRPVALCRLLACAEPGPLTALRVAGLLKVADRPRMGLILRLPTANALAFVFGTLVPSHAFLKGRYGSAWGYAKRWCDLSGRMS